MQGGFTIYTPEPDRIQDITVGIYDITVGFRIQLSDLKMCAKSSDIEEYLDFKS